MKNSILLFVILSCCLVFAYSQNCPNGVPTYPCNDCKCTGITRYSEFINGNSFEANDRQASKVTFRFDSDQAVCGSRVQLCPYGHHGGYHDKSICGYIVKLCSLMDWEDQEDKVISSNSQNSGTWQEWKKCPKDQYASGMSSRKGNYGYISIEFDDCNSSKNTQYPVGGIAVTTSVGSNAQGEFHYVSKIDRLRYHWYCGGYQCSGCAGNKYAVNGNCQNCNYKCATCTDGNTCTSCPSNRSGTYCECNKGFYESNQQCHTCSQNCESCSNSNSCDSCIQPEAREGPKCECKKGWYKDGSQCSKCMEGCSVCSSANVCSVCENELQSGPQCDQCPLGYFYQSQDKSCQECRSECGSCSNYLECDTCRGNPLNRDSETCLCKEGFYEQGAHCLPEERCTEQLVQDPKNPENCQICNIYCPVCPTEGLCITPVGQSSYDLSQVPNCAGCSVQCHPCPQQFKEKQSTCPKLINDSCGKAEITCLDCRDESMENRNPAGDCSCKEGFYDYKGQKCQACKESCKTCDNISRCTSCQDNSNKIIDTLTGDCICKPDFYTDAQGNCQTCSSRCNGCSDSQTCKKCQDPNRTIESSCTECKEGYWMNQDVCQKCSNNCTTCSGRETCTSCPEGRELEAGECVCKLGTYPINETECGTCPAKCPSCTGPDSCEGYCAGNRKIENNCECEEDELDIPGQDCQKCNKKCSKCVDNVDTCDPDSPCSNEMRIKEENCRCPDGYTSAEDGIKCEKCSNENCKKCDSGNDTCETCWSEYRHGSECKCPPGQFEIGVRECGTCNPECETCSGSESNCTTCKDPENRDIPSCECKEGMWDDNGVCKPRVTCTKIEIQSASEICNAFSITCNVCAEGESKCVPACSHGICTQNDLDILPQCLAEECTVSEPEKCDQDTKECVCDPGFYQVAEDRNDCWPCHYSCETCSAGEDTDCITCPDKSAPVDGKCPVQEIDVDGDDEGQDKQFIESKKKNIRGSHIKRN